MSRLSERERSLIGLGAALASNCVPCIEAHIPMVRRAGAGEDEIREAIQVADRVRRVPARLVFQAAMARLRETSSDAASAAASGCGCVERDGSGCVG